MGDRQIHHAEKELGYRLYLVGTGKGIRVRGMEERGKGGERERGTKKEKKERKGKGEADTTSLEEGRREMKRAVGRGRWGACLLKGQGAQETGQTSRFVVTTFPPVSYNKRARS